MKISTEFGHKKGEQGVQKSVWVHELRLIVKELRFIVSTIIFLLLIYIIGDQLTIVLLYLVFQQGQMDKVPDNLDLIKMWDKVSMLNK